MKGMLQATQYQTSKTDQNSEKLLKWREIIVDLEYSRQTEDVWRKQY